MAVIAATALVVNHYVFSHNAALPATPTTTTTTSLTRAYQACTADGAAISTAIAAFEAQNPGVIVSQTALVGPYLQSWANNPSFYVFNITNGVLYLKSAISDSSPVRYVGAASCQAIGL